MSHKVMIPIRIDSTANLREHWAKKAARMKNQRLAARCMATFLPFPDGKITIMLTRIAPRKLDSDNLASALKAIRDGVADAMKRNDGDPSITWLYFQEKRKPHEYGVIVEVA